MGNSRSEHVKFRSSDNLEQERANKGKEEDGKEFSQWPSQYPQTRSDVSKSDSKEVGNTLDEIWVAVCW